MSSLSSILGIDVLCLLIIIDYALLYLLAVAFTVLCINRCCFRRPTAHDELAQFRSPVLVLPMKVFSAGMRLAGGKTVAECVICLLEFESGEEISVFPRCNHGFHAKCIKRWLDYNSSCPTCRTGFWTPPPEIDIV